MCFHRLLLDAYYPAALFEGQPATATNLLMFLKSKHYMYIYSFTIYIC